MLHAINPSFVTGLALVIGGALALLAGLAIVWPHVRTETAMGAGPSRGIVAARFGRISPSSVGLGSSRTLALLAIAALLGIAAAWGLATAAAGIAYLGYYLLALAAAGAAAVWGGFSAIAGAGHSRETAVSVRDGDAAEQSSHEALASAVLALLSSVAALPLVAPIAGAMRAAPQQGALWADRQLRALSVDSPTVVLGFAFGVVAVLAVVAFIATPTRAVLANAVTEARIALAEQSSARGSSDGPDDCGDEVLFEGLESALRRTSAIVVMCALLAPAVCGFGIGAASLPAFAVGVVVASGVVAAAAHVRVASSEAALARVESGVAGGTASLAYSSVLTEVSEARARVSLTSSLAGASGFGAIAVLMTLAAAPAVVSLTGDEGTHPLVRVIIVVAALMVLVVSIVLSRGLEQVDLADNLRDATDRDDQDSRASTTVREKTSSAQAQSKKRAAQSKRNSDAREENRPESNDLVDDIFGESEVLKKKRGRKRK